MALMEESDFVFPSAGACVRTANQLLAGRLRDALRELDEELEAVAWRKKMMILSSRHYVGHHSTNHHRGGDAAEA